MVSKDEEVEIVEDGDDEEPANDGEPIVTQVGTRRSVEWLKSACIVTNSVLWETR
jgi:hypothetical protein